MINTAEIAMNNSVVARAVERRSNPRYEFIADAEVLEVNSGMTTPGRTADLSRGGCYVDTINPFPAGSRVMLLLTKWGRTFEAQAKVVYSKVGMGMGLMFVPVDAEQRRTLENWLAELERADAEIQ